jgi:hypothetical protein
LTDQDIKFSDFTEKLKGLGIQLNLDGTAYEILRGLTGWQFLAENIEAVKVGELSKEDFVEACFKYIEARV